MVSSLRRYIKRLGRESTKMAVRNEQKHILRREKFSKRPHGLLSLLCQTSLIAFLRVPQTMFREPHTEFLGHHEPGSFVCTMLKDVWLQVVSRSRRVYSLQGLWLWSAWMQVGRGAIFKGTKADIGRGVSVLGLGVGSPQNWLLYLYGSP